MGLIICFIATVATNATTATTALKLGFDHLLVIATVPTDVRHISSSHSICKANSYLAFWDVCGYLRVDSVALKPVLQCRLLCKADQCPGDEG